MVGSAPKIAIQAHAAALHLYLIPGSDSNVICGDVTQQNIILMQIQVLVLPEVFNDPPMIRFFDSALASGKSC